MTQHPTPIPPPAVPGFVAYDELQAVPDGLTAEQEIRARALDCAAYVIGDISGTVRGVAQHVIDMAEPLVGWIRDGSRPGVGCTCYGIPNRPGCPEHGEASRDADWIKPEVAGS